MKMAYNRQHPPLRTHALRFPKGCKFNFNTDFVIITKYFDSFIKKKSLFSYDVKIKCYEWNSSSSNCVICKMGDVFWCFWRIWCIRKQRFSLKTFRFQLEFFHKQEKLQFLRKYIAKYSENRNARVRNEHPWYM